MPVEPPTERISASPLMNWRAGLLLAICAAAIVALAMHAPIAQDPAYHVFADTRTLLGVANFWNVASNLPFLAVGAIGVIRIANGRAAAAPGLQQAYLLLFLGVALVGLGSGFYHWRPGNNTLVWDRLPMTLAFMAFFAIVLGEHIDITLGRRLLWPLVIVGACSVGVWHLTEMAGQGDLRLYAGVQFLPVLLIPLILLLYPRPGVMHVWLALAAYAFAKALEYFDRPVYEALGGISGHSLKHLVAAAGMAALLVGLRGNRDPRRG